MLSVLVRAMHFGPEFETTRIPTTGAGIHVTYGGSGPPLLLLHGYPETHAMWHAVAPVLAREFFVVCPDLRGYGDSDKPQSDTTHSPYAKRAMAEDMVEVMAALGHEAFYAAGHDRGARVVHRMTLDHPDTVRRAAVLDIVPTRHMFETADRHFAAGYYHWFFLIQPGGLPERLIGADPAFFLAEKLARWSAPGAEFDDAAVAEYLRAFDDPATIHATCEDYRAAATIDLEHDAADRDRKVGCPLLVLWGRHGFVHRTYDVLEVWRAHADDVTGRALECGHFLPEEAPGETVSEMRAFFLSPRLDDDQRADHAADPRLR